MKIPKRILKFIPAFFLPIQAIASTIPSYQITEIHWPEIKFNNDAIFTIHGLYWQVVPQWNNNDEVLLERAALTFPSIIIISANGTPVLESPVVLSNLTQGTSVVGYLSTPPDTNILSIQAINPTTGEITLSDSSIWRIHPADQRFFDLWDIADAVLLGKNKGLETNTFDALLFNTAHLNSTRAIEISP